MTIRELVTAFLGDAIHGAERGAAKLAIHEAGLGDLRSIELESPAFEDGSPIPKAYSADGDGCSPPLRWGPVPEETRELVLLCEDPDAPKPTPFVHWALYGIPPTVHDLSAGASAVGGAKVREGMNSTLADGWTPPSPPTSHGVHHYHFELFALDQPLALGDHARRGAIVDAMRGHVVAKGELVGTYRRD